MPEPPADPRPTFPVAIFDQAVDGCVYIFRENDGVPIEGTGALIDADNRLVLTTCQVVGDSDVVSVQFPFHNPDGTVETDRCEYTRSAEVKLTPMGRVVHRDKARDLALVQLDRLGRNARPLELAETGAATTVLHIGSGSGELFPMTLRRVVQVDPPAGPEPATGTTESVQAPTLTLTGHTDDSGGPLIDRTGRLVGIVAAGSTDPGGRPITRAIGTPELRAFLADNDKPAPSPPATPIVKAPDSLPDRTLQDFTPAVDPVSKELDVEALYKKVRQVLRLHRHPGQGRLRHGLRVAHRRGQAHRPDQLARGR